MWNSFSCIQIYVGQNIFLNALKIFIDLCFKIYYQKIYCRWYTQNTHTCIYIYIKYFVIWIVSITIWVKSRFSYLNNEFEICLFFLNPQTLHFFTITELKKYFRASSYSDCGNGPAEEGEGFDGSIRQTHTLTHIQKIQTGTLSAKHLHKTKTSLHECDNHMNVSRKSNQTANTLQVIHVCTMKW